MKLYAVIYDEKADTGCGLEYERFYSDKEIAELVAEKWSGEWVGYTRRSKYYVEEIEVDLDVDKFRAGLFPYTFRARLEKDGSTRVWGGPDLYASHNTYYVTRSHDRYGNLIGLTVSFWAHTPQQVEDELNKIWKVERGLLT